MNRLRFNTTIYTGYAAVIVVLFLVQLYRPTITVQWTYMTSLGAALGDAVLIGLFMSLFWVVEKYLCEQRPSLRKLNRILHIGLIVSALAMTMLSQMLFMKTGETLDWHIIRFAVANASDLARVLGSEAGMDVLYVIVLCLLPPWLLALHISNPLLRRGRTLVLFLPIAVLPACSLLEEDIDSVVKVVDVVPNKAREVYQGEYTLMTERQLRWNGTPLSHWQQGALTGLFSGTLLGKVEFQAVASRAGSVSLYERPAVKEVHEKKRNVVMILLESVRHDVVGAYAQGDDGTSLTPFMDSLARNGGLVTTAYTTIPHTSKALVGIYCGSFPSFDSSIAESEPRRLPLRCLPDLLRDAGYRSAHFQTAPAAFEDRNHLLDNMGFDYYVTQESLPKERWEALGYLGIDDRAMIGPAVSWMKKQKASGRPYFASFLTIATHHPYSSPGHRLPISTPAEAFSSYKVALAYTDSVVKELFETLKKEGLTEDTLFVITGDHGEGFAEHGQIAHNGTAYEEGMRVPLILYSPGNIAPGSVINGLRQHIDIMPTVLEFAGVDYSGKLPGRGLLSSKDGHDEIITACFYTDYCLNHYRSDGYKTLYFYGRRPSEIYNLREDPLERHKLPYEDAPEFLEQNLQAAARLKNSYQWLYRTTLAEYK